MSFAESVKRRDKRCAMCQSNKNLQAHHLYSKSSYPTQKNKIENGLTLCEVHHQEFHRMYGGNCTGLHFLEWLHHRFIQQNCGVSRKLLLELFGRVMKIHHLFHPKEVLQTHVSPKDSTELSQHEVISIQGETKPYVVVNTQWFLINPNQKVK